MGHDDDPGSRRMPEDMVRSADTIETPAGGDQFAYQVRTLHRVYHTHRKAPVNRSLPSRCRPADRRTDAAACARMVVKGVSGSVNDEVKGYTLMGVY